MSMILLRRGRRVLRPNVTQGNRHHLVPNNWPLPPMFYGNDTGRVCNDFEDVRKEAVQKYAASEVIRLDGMSSHSSSERGKSFYMNQYGVTPWADICRTVAAPCWGVGKDSLESKPLSEIYPELQYVPDETKPEIPRDISKTLRDNAQHPFGKAPATGRPWLTNIFTRLRFIRDQKSPVVSKDKQPAQGRDWRDVTFGERWHESDTYHTKALKGKLRARKRVASNEIDWEHRGSPLRIRSAGIQSPEIDKFNFFVGLGPEFLTMGVKMSKWPANRVYLFYQGCYWTAFFTTIGLAYMTVMANDDNNSWTPCSPSSLTASPYPMYAGLPGIYRLRLALRRGPFWRSDGSHGHKM